MPHDIPEPFLSHIREVTQQMQSTLTQRDVLDGKARQLEQEHAMMKRHLSVTLDLAVKQLGLPEGKYRLSEDGKQIAQSE